MTPLNFEEIKDLINSGTHSENFYRRRFRTRVNMVLIRMDKLKFLLVLAIASLALVHGMASRDYSDHTITDNGVLASVREYPSLLHKCSATFITKSILVTTAVCLLCIGNCKLYVALLHTHLEDSRVIVHDVKDTLIHPKFERNTEFNIGLVYLKKDVMQAPVHELPDPNLNVAGVPAYVYSWLFGRDLKDFRLVAAKGTLITNELCSYYLSEFVSNKYICVHGEKLITLGPWDHGSPAITTADNIVGFFSDPGFIGGDEIVQYTSIFPYLNWIKNNTAPDPIHPTTHKPHPKPTTTPRSPGPLPPGPLPPAPLPPGSISESRPHPDSALEIEEYKDDINYDAGDYDDKIEGSRRA